MTNQPLLHAVRITLISPEQIARALRDARLAHEQAKDENALLFICDLPDAQAQVLPEDAELIRCVQSGVMSMAARRPDTYYFIVRKRKRDETLRFFCGEKQTPCARETLRALLLGEGRAAFAASNISPGALRGRFGAALVTDASLAAPPDTPERMRAQLFSCGLGALGGQVVIPRREEEPIFHRLLRAGFSLSFPPPAPFDMQDEPLAAIYTPDALSSPPDETVQGCAFVWRDPLTLSDLFSRAQFLSARARLAACLAPLTQFLLLFVCAVFGWELPAVLALVLPEIGSLLHIRQIPCALVRLALLPRRAMIAANALLSRRMNAGRFSISLSNSSGACAFAGGALLILAVMSTHAFAVLLAVSLLWLGAPLMERALSLPARERIPLTDEESRALRAMAESAFSALSPEAADTKHLLAACAGCMMELLEPDEAARRAERMLPRLSCTKAFDCACLLCAAQFFQERMAQCDAALRELPARLIALVRAPEESEGGVLAALLRAALDHAPTEDALASLRRGGAGGAMDALFLPGQPIRDARLLPLTHPHTFLRRALPSAFETDKKSDPLLQSEEADRSLILSCAALGSPFGALFLRSAPVAPYAPLLGLI